MNNQEIMNKNTEVLNNNEGDVKMSKKEQAKQEMLALLSKSVNARIQIEKDMILNNVLLGKRPQTLKMVDTPRETFDPFTFEDLWKDAKDNRVPENRLSRFLKLSGYDVEKEITITLKNGQEFKGTAVNQRYATSLIPDIIYKDFVGEPSNPMAVRQMDAHIKSKKKILEGFTKKFNLDGVIHEVKYVYAVSSSSQQRTLKGVFVREDFKFSDEYLALFDTSNPETAEYVEMIKDFRGAECIYEAMTYGSYSREFRNKNYSAAKFGARVGTCLTSTKSLGSDCRVKLIGEVKVNFTTEVFFAMRKQLSKHFNRKTVRAIIRDTKNMWKREKLDGQSMISAEYLSEAIFKSLGIYKSPESLVGELIQLRWAGVKGTALVVSKAMMDACELPDGTKPYEGFDFIVEYSSWKYTPAMDHFKGDLAPELELVRMSKAKFTNNLNYQFVQALDGDNKTTKDIFKKLIDRMFDGLMEAMQIPEVARHKFGMSSRDEVSDDLEIDSYIATIRSKVTKGLDACDDIIFDPKWRQMFLNVFAKLEEDAGYGRILVEGANRYIISDPTPMFRTDLAVPRLKKDGSVAKGLYGEDMFDIIITRMDQVGIQGTTMAYWNDNACPAVLFRSPCVHPGEPQRTDLVSASEIPEVIKTGYGDLRIRDLFKKIKKLCVINVFSSILDALGGADTDGDTSLVCTDPLVVQLRNPVRRTLLTSSDAAAVLRPINPETMKQYMSESLRDSGIGKITNYGTTWRDIESCTVFLPESGPNKGRLPANVRKALMTCAAAAIEEIKLRGDSMDAYERQAAQDVADLASMTAAYIDGKLVLDPSKVPYNPTAKYEKKPVYINDDVHRPIWRAAVIKACEGAMRMIRRLQETAIDTAKTGFWVEFDKYGYLGLKVRPSWHGARVKQEFKYESTSVMGFVDSYATKRWKEIQEWAMKTSRPVVLSDSESVMAKYIDVYKKIRELKAECNTKLRALDREYAGKWKDDDAMEEKSLKWTVITEEYHTALRILAMNVGNIDDMSVLVYMASNDGDKSSKTTTDGLAFVWHCWADEFIHTLKYRASGSNSTRLVMVQLAKEFETCLFADGEYVVENCEIKSPSMPNVVIGKVNVPDDVYKMVNYDGRPYVVLGITKPTIDVLNASLKDVVFRVIGFQHQLYKGCALTKNKVKDMMFNEMGCGTIAVKSVIVDIKMTDGSIRKEPRAVVYIRTEEGKPWAPIGNIPYQGGKDDMSKIHTEALSNKILKVQIAKKIDQKDIETRLFLQVVSVIKDLNQ